MLLSNSSEATTDGVIDGVMESTNEENEVGGVTPDPKPVVEDPPNPVPAPVDPAPLNPDPANPVEPTPPNPGEPQPPGIPIEGEEEKELNDDE